MKYKICTVPLAAVEISCTSIRA